MRFDYPMFYLALAFYISLIGLGLYLCTYLMYPLIWMFT